MKHVQNTSPVKIVEDDDLGMHRKNSVELSKIGRSKLLYGCCIDKFTT